MNNINNKSVKRVCANCIHNDDYGSNVTLIRNNVNNVILFEGKYYHKDCFINMCNEKISKRKTKKWIDALENINVYECDAFNLTNEYFDKDDVYQFIIHNYDLVVIPSYTWTKINKIYTGELEGMSVGIPPAHLFDMWKRQIGFLNKTYSRNKTKGKEMNNAQRLNYDLSILINKYDSYLAWIESQKILEKDTISKPQQQVNKINYQTLSNMKNEKENNSDDIDILLDEIFE